MYLSSGLSSCSPFHQLLLLLSPPETCSGTPTQIHVTWVKDRKMICWSLFILWHWLQLVHVEELLQHECNLEHNKQMRRYTTILAVLYVAGCSRIIMRMNGLINVRHDSILNKLTTKHLLFLCNQYWRLVEIWTFCQIHEGLRRDSDIIIIILRNTVDWLSAYFTFNNPGCFYVIMA